LILKYFIGYRHGLCYRSQAVYFYRAADENTGSFSGAPGILFSRGATVCRMDDGFHKGAAILIGLPEGLKNNLSNVYQY
jgi:hypothetical protein